MELVFNIDFDGTCVTNDFPRVGKDIGAQRVLKKLVEKGHKLVLLTMRSGRARALPTKTPGIENVTGDFLTDAIEWFKTNEIPLCGVQAHPTQKYWTTSPKSYANFRIDDSGIGCPLKFDASLSDKNFVDWVLIEAILVKNKII